MAVVTAVTATPSTVSPGGGTSTIKVDIDNPMVLSTVTVEVDGSQGTQMVTINETLVYSVDQTKVGARGYIVAKVDTGGTIAVGADQQSFVFTAS